MGDSQITEEKAEYGLHIRHIHRLYHARYGYKGYSRNRCANHSESNDVPWRLVFSFKKRCIRTSFPSGDTGYQQENAKSTVRKKGTINAASMVRLPFFKIQRERLSLLCIYLIRYLLLGEHTYLLEINFIFRESTSLCTLVFIKNLLCNCIVVFSLIN